MTIRPRVHVAVFVVAPNQKQRAGCVPPDVADTGLDEEPLDLWGAANDSARVGGPLGPGRDSNEGGEEPVGPQRGAQEVRVSSAHWRAFSFGSANWTISLPASSSAPTAYSCVPSGRTGPGAPATPCT